MPPISKRRRLNKQSPFPEDVYQSRARNDLWLKSRFESIFAKYERNFEEIGDEIELDSGRIVVNNGHLLSMHDEYDVGQKRQVEWHNADGFKQVNTPSRFGRLLEEHNKSYSQDPSRRAERHHGIPSPPASFQPPEDDVDSLLGDVLDLEDQPLGHSKRISSAPRKRVGSSTWTAESFNAGGIFHFDIEPRWRAPPLPVKRPISYQPTPPSEQLTSCAQTGLGAETHPQMSLWTESPFLASSKSSTHLKASSERRMRRPAFVWTKDEIRKLRRSMKSSNIGLMAIASKFPDKPKSAIDYRLKAMRRLTPSEMKTYILSCPDQVAPTSEKIPMQEDPGMSGGSWTESRPEKFAKKPGLPPSGLSPPSLSRHEKRDPARKIRSMQRKPDTPPADKEAHKSIPRSSLGESEMVGVLAKKSKASISTGAQRHSNSKRLGAETQQPSLAKDQVLRPPLSPLSPCPPNQVIPFNKAAEQPLVPVRPINSPIAVDYPKADEEVHTRQPKPSKRESRNYSENVQPQGSAKPPKNLLPIGESGIGSAVAGPLLPLKSSSTKIPIRTKVSSSKLVKSSTLKKLPVRLLADETTLKPNPLPATPRRAQLTLTKSSKPHRESSLHEDLSEDELSTPVSKTLRITPKSVSCKKAAISYRPISDDNDIDDLQL